MARKQFLLRIDPELWKELEKWAADDLRSVNAQVEWLLREAARTRRGKRAKTDHPERSDTEEHEGDRGESERGESEQRPGARRLPAVESVENR